MIQNPPLDFNTKELLSRFHGASDLQGFFDLLMAENQRINLVSRETNQEDLRRLSTESLAPMEQIAQPGFHRYLDIGSGGGFPAIVILLAARAGRFRIEQSVLVERRQRRADALGRIVKQLNLPAEISPHDFIPGVPDGRFDLITLRYVKLTPSLWRLISNALTDAGCFVYYSKPEFEIDSSQYTTIVQPFTLNGAEPIKNYTIVRKNC
ncbi:MAG: class I SAM-dependent methyltransferase [candidate division Zixibacteria bacterium]|nr:class I SAM-dependent methyltransferase [candidate division Zixibacteria bacterium]MDH3936390.1 class I SAM-dependent methyltransferase [candidate division Zixibacteria bacterium]MDH4033502.1 class I SAM-dependent methyltransferase [candidate division Zixibacteria bacterium]